MPCLQCRAKMAAIYTVWGLCQSVAVFHSCTFNSHWISPLPCRHTRSAQSPFVVSDQCNPHTDAAEHVMHHVCACISQGHFHYLCKRNRIPTAVTPYCIISHQHVRWFSSWTVLAFIDMVVRVHTTCMESTEAYCTCTSYCALHQWQSV